MESSDREVFTADPNSWPYIFCPPLYISCVLAFIFPFAIAPLIGKKYYPKQYAALGRDQGWFNSLAGSTLHAIFVSGATFYMLQTGAFGDYLVFCKSQFGFVVMQLSLGYFFGDLFFCLSDEKLRDGKIVLIHHLACMTGLFLCLYTQGHFMFFIIICYIFETSTPFVNAFYVLKFLNKTDTTLFTVVSLSMVVAFFLSRIVPTYWLWRLLIQTLMSPGSAIIKWYLRLWCVITYVIFHTLNFYWFWKMLKGCVKRFTQGTKEAVAHID